MAVITYVGVEEVCIKVESIKDVWDAIDEIHTQCMDALGEDSPVLRVLEEALAKIEGMER